MPVYLGLDSSTQSLTASLIRAGDGAREAIAEYTLPFDQTFPEFGTTNGVIRGDAAGVVAAPPLLWVAALDRMMGDLVAKWPREMAELAAVSGSAQQHGSVYLHARGLARLSSLDAREPLAPQLADGFSRPLAGVDGLEHDGWSAGRSNARSVERTCSRAAPGPARSSDLPAHRSARLPSASRTPIATQRAFTWSRRSWRPFSQAQTHQSSTATAPA